MPAVSTMLVDPPAFRSPEPDKFLVELPSQINAETLRFRAGAINTILRAHLLSRQEMDLDEALGQFFDLAGEVVFYDGGFAFFYEEDEREMRLRLVRDVRSALDGDKLLGANLLNYWTAKYWRPVLVRLGQHPQVDGLLRGIGAGCVLAVPLLAGNRPRGTLQLFGADPLCFSSLDAQLLWILAMGSERLFTAATQAPAAAAQSRRDCEERLERELVRAEGRQSPLSLLLLEIDRFHLVHDIYGRKTGEAILNEVLSSLVRKVRGLDMVVRSGNAEFAVILPDTMTAGGYCVAERLKEELEETCFFADGPASRVRLTISAGLSLYPVDSPSASGLLQSAGLALKHAQGNGRNRIVLYSELGYTRQESGASAPRETVEPERYPIDRAASQPPRKPPERETYAASPRAARAESRVEAAGLARENYSRPQARELQEFLPAAPLPAPAQSPAMSAGFDLFAPESQAASVPVAAATSVSSMPAAKPAAAAAAMAPASIPAIQVQPEPAVAVSASPQLVAKAIAEPKPAAEPKSYTGLRREQRMNITLTVRVWGMDLNGELFEQDAYTIDITTTGARVAGITHPLERGCVVGIKHQTSKARYRVKWVGPAGSQIEGQIGLQLVDEGKLIWGRALRRVLGDDFDGSGLKSRL